MILGGPQSFERCMDRSGIRSAVGAVVGLCSRWKAGNLLQRACVAMGLGNCTVGTWGYYTDPVSPAKFFDFFTGNLADW
jgi:hypothetical protein